MPATREPDNKDFLLRLCLILMLGIRRKTVIHLPVREVAMQGQWLVSRNQEHPLIPGEVTLILLHHLMKSVIHLIL